MNTCLLRFSKNSECELSVDTSQPVTVSRLAYPPVLRYTCLFRKWAPLQRTSSIVPLDSSKIWLWLFHQREQHSASHIVGMLIEVQICLLWKTWTDPHYPQSVTQSSSRLPATLTIRMLALWTREHWNEAESLRVMQKGKFKRVVRCAWQSVGGEDAQELVTWDWFDTGEGSSNWIRYLEAETKSFSLSSALTSVS